MSNKTYDVLKFVAQIVLPAVATLYFTLAQIWHLPKAEEVVGTIVAVDTFLGVLLGVSARQYHRSDDKYDGVMEIEEPAEGPRKFSLTLNKQPENLESKTEILFKVTPK